jgi:hypothetical protein
METLKVHGWALLVGGTFVGYGVAVLRLLRLGERGWLAGACAGTGVVIALLGWLNLLGWIRPWPLCILVAAGDLLLLLLWRRPKAERIHEEPAAKRRTTIFTVATWLVLALAGWMAFSGIDCRIVNASDDAQAYLAYPVNALETGKLQPQPFSERRINTSLGANYLLHALMVVDGDVRSVSFLDCCFGYVLYAAAIWAVGRQMRVSFEEKGLLLLLLSVLPLIQLNATMVYLSAALMVALLLEMHAAAESMRADWRRGVVWGLLASALCLTKSTNIVFTLLLIALFALVHAARKRSMAQIWNAAISAVALAVLAAPWMVQQHRNEGTYFFPALGRGYHASRWGVVLLPGQTQGLSEDALTALPDVLVLLCAALAGWKLRSRSSSFDFTLVVFSIAAMVATPIVCLATGGDALDRLTFPFHIPALLLFAALVLATAKTRTTGRRWVWAGRALLTVWTGAISGYFLLHNHLYRTYENRMVSAVGIKPDGLDHYELQLTNGAMRAEAERARNAQETVPPGEQVLEAVLYAVPYDFRRNTIYIADFPGMAGWAPGIPLGRGPDAVRGYFLSHGIHYVFCDRRLAHNNEDIGDFLKDPATHVDAKDFLVHPLRSRFKFGWERMEDCVSRDVRHNLLLLAKSDDKLYDDGTVVAVRLRGR